MKRVLRYGLTVWLLVAASMAPQALPVVELVPSVHAQQPDVTKAQRLRELRQKVEDAKHRKLRDALALDEQTAPKFFEHYRVAERDIQELSRKRNAEMRELYRMMRGAGTDAQVDPAIERIRDLTNQIERRQIQLDNDLKPILSPRQRAKLLAFEQEFNRRVKEQVKEHRVDKRGGRVDKDLQERVKQQLGKKWGKGRGPRGGEGDPPGRGGRPGKK
jgi:hypothetical protein